LITKVWKHQKGVQVGADHAADAVVSKEWLAEKELKLVSIWHDQVVHAELNLLWRAVEQGGRHVGCHLVDWAAVVSEGDDVHVHLHTRDAQ
jgi:hypothetical protein